MEAGATGLLQLALTGAARGTNSACPAAAGALVELANYFSDCSIRRIARSQQALLQERLTGHRTGSGRAANGWLPPARAAELWLATGVLA